jgi:hypothetical protein
MAIEYWECRGTYGLDGHAYTEVIGGSRTHLLDGQTLPAVAVPGDPGLLSTTTALAHHSSAWTPYVTPTILGALVVISSLGWAGWSRRQRRRRFAQSRDECPGPRNPPAQTSTGCGAS